MNRRRADWITEVKWDGYRTQIVKDDRVVRAYTRNGYDGSTRYWPITLTASVMPFKSGIIDGEVVVLDDHHRSNFNELQGELSARRSNRLLFVAFDLLHVDGMDMRKLPLVVRRERLERLGQTADGGRIQFSEALPGTPHQVFNVVDRAGLEGVVCKQAATCRKLPFAARCCSDLAELALASARCGDGQIRNRIQA